MEASKFEHRKALKADLQALWSWLQLELSDEIKTRDAALITELDALLKDKNDDFSWIECNRAELLMLPLLPAVALDAQLRRRLDQARSEGALSPERYKDMVERLLGNNVPELEVKREALRALLTELHQLYVNRRFRREQRAGIAGVLKWFAICILVLAIIPIMAFVGLGRPYISLPDQHQLMQSSLFCVCAAWVFGIIGAFFSRLVSFQTRAETFGYEEILNTFSTHVILVRCATGMFGAMVFYFLMRSGLLGGSLFLSDGVATQPNDPAQADFAKLLVWSFIAGWSERLVPETLERTESSAKSSQPPKAPA